MTSSGGRAATPTLSAPAPADDPELLPATPDRPGNLVRFAVSMAAIRLGAGLLLAHLALTVLPHGAFVLNPGTWADGFVRWDSGWYVGMASDFYPFARSTVFFPGYPVVVGLLRWATFHHLSLDAAGLAVNWVAFVASAPLVARAVEGLTTRRTAYLATTLYTWSPASVFLLSIYPESSFLLLSAAVLLCLRRGRLWPAAVVSGVATAFSPLGVCLAAAVVVAAWRRAGPAKTAALTGTSVSGLAAWMSWLWVAYGSPVEFLTQQRTFNRHTVPPFGGLVGALLHPHAAPPAGIGATNFTDTRAINTVFAALGLILFVYFVADLLLPRLRRHPPWFDVYAALTFLLPAMSTQMFYGVANPEAMTRLTLSSIGVFVALALVLESRRWILAPALCLWIALGVVMQSVFVLGYYFT